MTQSEQYKQDLEDAIKRETLRNEKETLELLRRSDYGNLR